jgi:hypothetical protein
MYADLKPLPRGKDELEALRNRVEQSLLFRGGAGSGADGGDGDSEDKGEASSSSDDSSSSAAAAGAGAMRLAELCAAADAALSTAVAGGATNPPAPQPPSGGDAESAAAAAAAAGHTPAAPADAEPTTLAQRFAAASGAPPQPVARGAMLPRRKPLMNKRSRRCPKCNVIIIKPELNPSSTVFRKYLVAMDLLPTLRARWEGMARTHAVICIVNPAALAMTLRLGLSPTFRTTVGEFSEIEAHDERVSARCADDPEYVLDRAGNLVLLRLRVMQLPTDIAAPGEAEFIGLRCELGYTSDQGNGVSITFDAKLEIVE